MPSRALTRLRHPAEWTLRTKLVVAVLTLFTLVTLIIGGLTIAVTQRYLSGQLIDDLRSVSARQDAVISSGQRPGPMGGDLDRDDGPRGIPGGAAQTLVLGLTPAGAIATDHHGNTLNSVVDRRGNLTTLNEAQIQDIVAARVGGEPERVTISGDIGSYLLVARTAADGTIRVTGLPTRGIDGVLRTLAQLILGGLALGLVGMWLGGSYLIRRNLAPLARVAAVAQRVSALRLDSGKVELPERVTLPENESHTEVGQVGTALNTMLDNVESALTAREASESKVRQFVADASHELRTPLASIRGYAELSRREQAPVPETVTHALGRVESEAIRMQGLVEDLLLLARLDAGRPLDREPVDLTRIVMDAVSDARVASPDHRWELDLPEEPATVLGDEARLRQVLVNLLANARTHTPPGTRVLTTLRADADTAYLRVVDDGPGIPADLQPRLFERFTRGDAARTRASGSTGLGLSIVAAVVQSHGGSVQVASVPGETRFEVRLPR